MAADGVGRAARDEKQPTAAEKPKGPSKNRQREQERLEAAVEQAEAALTALEDELAGPEAWATKYESAKSAARAHGSQAARVEDAYARARGVRGDRTGPTLAGVRRGRSLLGAGERDVFRGRDLEHQRPAALPAVGRAARAARHTAARQPTRRRRPRRGAPPPPSSASTSCSRAAPRTSTSSAEVVAPRHLVSEPAEVPFELREALGELVARRASRRLASCWSVAAPGRAVRDRARLVIRSSRKLGRSPARLSSFCGGFRRCRPPRAASLTSSGSAGRALRRGSLIAWGSPAFVTPRRSRTAGLRLRFAAGASPSRRSRSPASSPYRWSAAADRRRGGAAADRDHLRRRRCAAFGDRLRLADQDAGGQRHEHEPSPASARRVALRSPSASAAGVRGGAPPAVRRVGRRRPSPGCPGTEAARGRAARRSPGSSAGRRRAGRHSRARLAVPPERRRADGSDGPLDRQSSFRSLQDSSAARAASLRARADRR